jgi:hypothetical protein
MECRRRHRRECVPEMKRKEHATRRHDVVRPYCRAFGEAARFNGRASRSRWPEKISIPQQFFGRMGIPILQSVASAPAARLPYGRACRLA